MKLYYYFKIGPKIKLIWKIRARSTRHAYSKVIHKEDYPTRGNYSRIIINRSEIQRKVPTIN